jgi:multimeric flavodoxin WrbA
MMGDMKILVINSSPNRNGSTAKLVDMFADATELMGAEVERIDLEDYLIDSCGMCIRCLEKKECIFTEDLIQLKAKFMNADGVVIASPYFSGKPSECLEDFVNRLSGMSDWYYIFRNKHFFGISVSMHDDSKNIANYCATLNGLISNGNGVVSGTLDVSRISDYGIGEVDEDDNIKYKVTSSARDFIFKICSSKKTICS